jgi:hypothetical protein
MCGFAVPLTLCPLLQSFRDRLIFNAGRHQVVPLVRAIV